MSYAACLDVRSATALREHVQRRVASGTPKNFRFEAHILDKADGSEKPYKLLHDLVYDYCGGRNTKPQTFVAPADFETDFASIPTRTLKRILEPAKFVKSRKYVDGLQYPVWIYRQIGERIVLVGYRNDPIAYAAIVHDVICAGELLSAWGANRVFDRILRDEEVPQRFFLYLGVQAGCWITYFFHKSAEVRAVQDLVNRQLPFYTKGDRCL